MNTILNAMKQMDNITTTENGGITYKSTMSGIMDLFAMGAAYRKRSEDDVIFLFDKAFKEDETYALKCLFYLCVVDRASADFSEQQLSGWQITTPMQCAAI